MVQRFLCTTADENTWPAEEPILFLGEWCRRYSRKARWSALDAEVMPYHWDDRAKLYDDYLYLREFHERLLRDLADKLNAFHGVDHDLRYWRILAGPWLGYFTQMLFDRWCSIRQAVAEFDLSGTTILYGKEESLTPGSMADFTRLFVGDDWNHHIYGDLLHKLDFAPIRRQLRPAEDSNAPSRPASMQRMKLGVARGVARLLAKLSRDDDAFLLATYMPVLDEMKMHVRLGNAPQLWFSVAAVQIKPVATERDWVLPGASRCEFEVIARALIPRQIPTGYLEGYGQLCQQAQSLSWPRRPRLIWTSNAHCHDDVFKCWAAEKVEQGSRLVVGQHGGHFGTGRWCFVEEHDIAICDRYLSWGWTESRQSKVIAVGQLKSRRPLSVRHAQQRGAVLVGNCLPRYSYSMYSAPVAHQWLDYFNDECEFVERLPRRIQNSLTVRLHTSDYGWDQMLRWRERFAELCVDDGQTKMDDLIRRSRLYISTYNATTYLESLSMGVPTVIFWNPDHWEIRESAVDYFNELKRVGIFHETPLSAARHVAAVWDDVGAWWDAPAVVEVRQRFQRQFCFLPRDLPDRVEAALREVLARPSGLAPQ